MKSSRRSLKPVKFMPAESAPSFQAGPRVEHAAWAVLVLSLVLMFSTTFDAQFTLPKMLALRFLLPVLLTLWLWRVSRGAVRALPTAICLCAAALVMWWIVTTIMAVHRPTALSGAQGRFNGLWSHLSYLTLFALSASSGLARKDIVHRLRLIVGVLTFASVIGLVYHGGWDAFGQFRDRPISTIGNPVVLSACLGLAIPFAVVFAVDSCGLIRSAWIIASLLLMSAALATGSRGPLLGIVTSLIAFAWIEADVFGVSRRKSAVVGLVFLVVALAVTTYQRTGRFVPSLAGVARDASLRERSNPLEAGLNVLRDHPVVGVGFENFSIVYPKYRTADADRATPDVVPTMVHSGYLQAAATTGLPGLLLYGGLVGLVLMAILAAFRKTAERQRRLLLGAFLASLTCYLVADISGWEEVSLTGLFWIILGLGLAASHPDERRLDAVTPAWRSLSVGIATCWTITALVLAFQFSKAARAEQLIREARLHSTGDDWSATEARIERGLELGGATAEYVDAAGQLYAVRFGATGQRALYDRAAGLFNVAHQLNPFSEYVLIHRVALETSSLQQHAGQAAQDARETAAIVASSDWHNATAYDAVAQFRLAEGAFPEALSLVHRAQALRKDSVTYTVLEADIYHAMRKFQEAIAGYRFAASQYEVGSRPWITAQQRLTVSALEAGDAEAAVIAARLLVKDAPSEALNEKLLSLARTELAKKQ